jgi:murein DD-endopeptidase MepM/ murein hydrolase activator NlpD
MRANRKYRIFSEIILIAFYSCLFSSIALGDFQNDVNILGKWIPEGVEKVSIMPIASLEFREDGTYVSTATYRGKWEFERVDAISFFYNPPFDSKPINIQIDGDFLRDDYGVTWSKHKDANEINKKTNYILWDKYNSQNSMLKLKLNGCLLNTIYLPGRYEVDGKVIKTYNIIGSESPWIYEIKGDKIEIKSKKNPEIKFASYVMIGTTETAQIEGGKTFIQPCTDAGGYYSWLEGDNKNHLGHDYAAAIDTVVKPIADGKVYEIINIPSLCYDPQTNKEINQHFIWVKHRLSNGKYFYALYGHIEPFVKKDEIVKPDKPIGRIKQCYVWHKKKLVPAPHLHFGIWNSDEFLPPTKKLGYGPIREFTNPKEFFEQNRPYVGDYSVLRSQQETDELYVDLQKWLFGDAPNVQLMAKWDRKDCSIWGDVLGTGTNLLFDCRHTGIDFGATEGTPVHSATNGVVKKVEYGKNCTRLECLSSVVIYNEPSNVTFIYLHLKNITVKPRDRVKSGDSIIGEIGQRGPATGPHLHFEARIGQHSSASLDVRITVDPYEAVKIAKQRIDARDILGTYIGEIK